MPGKAGGSSTQRAISYDPEPGWCKAKCIGGDDEECAHAEVKEYYRPFQQLSRDGQQMLLNFGRRDKALLAKKEYYTTLKLQQSSRRYAKNMEMDRKWTNLN